MVQRMVRHRRNARTPHQIDALIAMPLRGGGGGDAGDRGWAPFAPAEAVVGDDHDARAVALRDAEELADHAIDRAEVALRNVMVAVVIHLRDLRLFRRREWCEDV